MAVCKLHCVAMGGPVTGPTEEAKANECGAAPPLGCGGHASSWPHTHTDPNCAMYQIRNIYLVKRVKFRGYGQGTDTLYHSHNNSSILTP